MSFFNMNGSGGTGDSVSQEQLDLKVDKVSGKGLSTNDYTTAEKTKLNGIATNANNYSHPSTHPPSIIAQDSSNRFVSDTEKSTWNSKATTSVATTSANGLMASADKSKLDSLSNYTHPTNHPASIITQTSTARFVSDTEKSTWNGKADNTEATTTTLGLVKKCEEQADSEAMDIETLKADFNSLLAKLKSAGIM